MNDSNEMNIHLFNGMHCMTADYLASDLVNMVTSTPKHVTFRRQIIFNKSKHFADFPSLKFQLVGIGKNE